MTQEDLGAAVVPADVQAQQKLVLVGGGIGAALFVLSLLVSFSWYADPQVPQVPQLPGLVVPTPGPTGLPTELPTELPGDIPTELPSGFPTDLPSDFPTDFPTFPDLPDLPGGNP
jgi:hypothetical protein